MGQCKKVHDVALRADYENSSKRFEYAFQKEALQHLKSFVGESERRTQFAKVKLAETQELLSTEEATRLQKIRQIDEEINTTTIQAEQLGSSGDVDGFLKMMETVEDLKKQKKTAEDEYRNATPASISQQQKLRVCEVCTSYLGVHDNDRRLADHFNGKLHLGFITIREKLKELEELVEDHHIKKLVSSEFDKTKPSKRTHSHSPEHSKHRHKHHRSRSRSEERKHKSSKHESHSSHHKHKHRHHRKDQKASPETESKNE
ncbi:Putative RNA-binding protein Luc7-like 1 [Araneus ventricosus]|uniref:RNA-binding protein Luc7-like 1 n=1 Tax=Araneus ventricosus TaxID=182803 RepID=A0A4Y2DGY8_ARAVE|nr:Putative RNA-binding protein Luc7-like 1 [Araneus ventricosus]